MTGFKLTCYKTLCIQNKHGKQTWSKRSNILNIVEPFRTTPVIIHDNLKTGFMLAQNMKNHFRLTANHIFVEISLYR